MFIRENCHNRICVSVKDTLCLNNYYKLRIIIKSVIITYINEVTFWVKKAFSPDLSYIELRLHQAKRM